MAKVAIVYWSGSGNTEAMAQAIENAAKVSGIGDMKLVDVLKTISEMEFESIKAFSSAVAGMNSMKEAIHTVKDLDDALVELKKSSEK